VTIPAVRSAESVRRWFASAGHDRQPPDVQERYLRILDDFCTYASTSPDELVAFCFLRKKDTGARFVSVKRRVTVNERIDGFVTEQGWTGKDAVANANVVRGFLIHNGVLIQGSIWTGS
jgi:hypothetical protein